MSSGDEDMSSRNFDHPYSGCGRKLFVTSIFCLVIALLLWALEFSPLIPALVVSFSIGWSMQGLFILLRPHLEPALGIPISSILISLAGLLIGLLLAATILYGDPLVLLLEAPGTVIISIVAGIIGYLIVNTRERLLRSQLELAQLEQTRAEQAQQLAVTELKVLQAQIEPHFLFNTLSNIQSLIHDEPATAEAMLGELTTLLRGSFSQSRSSTTTVEQELELVRAYLEIQKIRMGDRLSFSIEADANCSTVEIPPLLIQPLVENAITHGVEAEPCRGRVEVRASLQNGILEVTVTDSGPGPDAGFKAPAAQRSANGHGSALANIRARLQTAYGQSAGLKLFAMEPKGTRAQLQLPCDPELTPARTLPTESLP